MTDSEFPYILATDHKRRIRVVLVNPATIELQSTDDGPPVQHAERHALHVLAMRILSLEAEAASLRDVERQTRALLAPAVGYGAETMSLVTLAEKVREQIDEQDENDATAAAEAMADPERISHEEVMRRAGLRR